MARIRTIKPEFFCSEQVVRCSPTARLAFVGLWCFSDDAGRHPASAVRLKLEVFPGDSFSVAEVQAMVDELIAAGLILPYESKGERFWQVTGWEKHQRIQKKTVRYPAPVYNQSDSSTIPVYDQCDTSRIRNGKEGSGREGNTHTHTKHTVLESSDAVRQEDRVGESALPPEPMPPPAPAKRPLIARTDADLQPTFAAFCRGAGLPLVWAHRYILPTEQIFAHGVPPEKVRAIAAHYREQLRDGTPSLPRFASEFDRWRAALEARAAQASRPEVEVPAGRCQAHPGQDVAKSGMCPLCEVVAAIASEAAEVIA